jgi:uncharacterized protein (TIGR00369 family)
MTQAPPQDPSLSGWKTRPLEGLFDSVGPLWARKEEDVWAYGIVADKRHTNSKGVVHGGMLAALADHALSAIAWQAVDRRPCVTIQLGMQFIAAVQPGRLVEARGRVVRRTSSLVFMEGSLSVDGAEVATASAVLKIVK